MNLNVGFQKLINENLSAFFEVIKFDFLIKDSMNLDFLSTTLG